eukprot:gene4116-4362_t
MQSVVRQGFKASGHFKETNCQVVVPARNVIVRAAAVEAPPKLSATDKVRLGNSDLEVTACCLGTMTWGKQNTEAEAHQQLQYAIDEYGINFFDTAEMYPVPPAKETQGLTDKYIATWLKGKKRDSLVLATKVAGYGTHNTYLRDPPETVRVTPSQIKQSVDSSLQRLGTDYIDLLQIHWPDRYVPLFGSSAYDIANERQGDMPFDEQLRGLEEVIKAGKRGSYETDLAEMCRRHNVSLLAYSPLAGGALSGKYIKGDCPKTARFNLFPGYMERYNKSLARVATEEYVKLAAKYGLTPTQLALAWCRSRWFVTSSIIGATSLEQLKENLQAFNVQLPPEAVDDINAIYRKYRDPPTAA